MYTQQEYFLKSQRTVCVFVIHTNRNSNVYSVIFTSIWRFSAEQKKHYLTANGVCKVPGPNSLDAQFSEL